MDSSQWSNVLAAIELLFCLPMANGRLERVFSQLTLIKTNRRTNLGEDSLDYLVRVNVEGLPLSEWDASRAFELGNMQIFDKLTTKMPLLLQLLPL
jgi:hypothetical protein